MSNVDVLNTIICFRLDDRKSYKSVRAGDGTKKKACQCSCVVITGRKSKHKRMIAKPKKKRKQRNKKTTDFSDESTFRKSAILFRLNGQHKSFLVKLEFCGERHISYLIVARPRANMLEKDPRVDKRLEILRKSVPGGVLITAHLSRVLSEDGRRNVNAQRTAENSSGND